MSFFILILLVLAPFSAIFVAKQKKNPRLYLVFDFIIQVFCIICLASQLLFVSNPDTNDIGRAIALSLIIFYSFFTQLISLISHLTLFSDKAELNQDTKIPKFQFFRKITLFFYFILLIIFTIISFTNNSFFGWILFYTFIVISGFHFVLTVLNVGFVRFELFDKLGKLRLNR
jgi:hypothetical protein